MATVPSEDSSCPQSSSNNPAANIAPNWRQLRKRAMQGDGLRRVKYAKTRGGMPMSSALNLVVIGTGAPASPASILINGDHVNYLVNCGESVQRILVEHNIRLSKVEQIFCTSKSWDNVGGLLGMCLTLEQAGVPSFTIHGDADCLRIVRLHGGFAEDRFNDSQLRHHDHRTAGYFEDANFCVKTIELNPSRGASSGASITTHLFVFKPKPAPPNVDPLKCQELGMTKADSRLIKDLKDHFDDPDFSVFLSNGRKVQPADICMPQVKCGLILIFECPSLDFLSGLRETHTKGGHLFSEVCDGEDPALVVHMTHFLVTTCLEYQAFIDTFPPLTRHIVLDGACATPACVGVYRNQAIMHLAHPDIFPLLPGLDQAASPADSNSSTGDQTTDPLDDLVHEDVRDAVKFARPGLRFQIRPRPAFSDAGCLRVTHDEYVREAFAKSPDLKSIVESLEKSRNLKSQSSAYPRFVFLGTGASVPSKTRNVSAFLVEADASNFLLFDCGEGTYAQLVRHYGNESDTVLRHLRAVFISHMHADHHGGLFTILTEWRRVAGAQGDAAKTKTGRLALFAPQRVAGWLKVYTEIVLNRDGALLDHFELVASQDLCPPEWKPKSVSDRPEEKREPRANVKEVLTACGLRSLVAVPVLHACQPYGYVATLADGVKVVYSGDTMPCDRLVEAGVDCDVLVHESTMEDDLADEARLKKHSTIGQAVDVARRMNARYCILTHFSQRYSKIPPVYSNAQLFSDAAKDTDSTEMQIGVAFDHMRVTLADIGFFKHLLPFLKSAFPDCFETMVNNLEKRTNKKSRALEADVQSADGAASSKASSNG